MINLDAKTDEFVVLKAWNWDEDGYGKEYTTDSDPDGWCVYLRKPAPAPRFYDQHYEMDFLSEDQAIAYAGLLAIKHKTVIELE